MMVLVLQCSMVLHIAMEVLVKTFENIVHVAIEALILVRTF